MRRAEFSQRNYLLHCRTCGAGFFEMQKLLRHRDRCQGDALSTCHRCGQGFSDLASYSRHYDNCRPATEQAAARDTACNAVSGPQGDATTAGQPAPSTDPATVADG